MPQKLCFVVGPIGPANGPERNHADWLLSGIMRPVFNEHFPDFNVERADNINAPGMIDSQVINRLLDAELVVADMSFLNANAFYEMGIRHMKQGPIIHMYREGEKIPFDVAPYRAISFSYDHPSGLTAAQTALKSAIDEVFKPDFQVENPVTRARGALKLVEHATPEQRVLMDQVTDISARLSSLERMIDGALLTQPSDPVITFHVKTATSSDFAQTKEELIKLFPGGLLSETVEGDLTVDVMNNATNKKKVADFLSLRTKRTKGGLHRI